MPDHTEITDINQHYPNYWYWNDNGLSYRTNSNGDNIYRIYHTLNQAHCVNYHFHIPQNATIEEARQLITQAKQGDNDV